MPSGRLWARRWIVRGFVRGWCRWGVGADGVSESFGLGDEASDVGFDVPVQGSGGAEVGVAGRPGTPTDL